MNEYNIYSVIFATIIIFGMCYALYIIQPFLNDQKVMYSLWENNGSINCYEHETTEQMCPRAIAELRHKLGGLR